MANFEKIEELRDFLKTLPDEAVRMQCLLNIDRDKERVEEARKRTCGTVGCIAGWTALLFSPDDAVLEADIVPIAGRGDAVLEGEDPWYIAGELLDLNADQERHMFYAQWHTEKSWDDYCNPIKRSEVIAYLDKVIQEKDVMVKL